MKSPWQFRLRTLMIAVLLLALASWFGVKLSRNTTPDPTRMIQPTDRLQIDMKRALLPGRPIFGKRLVRPDCRVSLGFYGEVYVAGLTEAEARQKIALYLLKFLNDPTLGQVRELPGRYQRPTLQPISLWDPSEFSVTISP